ncbi:MAG TPA: YIEGIA family protein [Syntrophomonas sp.]|jgi:hypothetical protein|nr:YIEGIA family protein [Syntrophomonas sp.]HRW11712.1 YIEGIA family protein [Syntrophomonas sp.]
MKAYLVVILVGLCLGFVDRCVMLRNDYRHYPTYPHGHLTHLAMGFIAAGLGAMVVPAISKPDYVAVTFLVLAAQEFRNIRNMERESLGKLDENKLIGRGQDYIEGIAKVFEARNYLCMSTALISSAVTHIWSWPLGVVAGLVCILLSLKWMAGRQLGEVIEISRGKLHFAGSLLMVDDVVIMNVGLPATREKILAEGLGIILHPQDDDARMTLDNIGQRMAIIYDVVSILGSKIEINETELHPMARKNPDKGYLALFIVPNEPDVESLIDIVKKVPLLESAQGIGLSSLAGRKAAD